jgi:hypothetical protein
MSVSKREAELKAALTKELRRCLPHLLVLQYSTAGAPDREIIGCGVTTRWEFKHATPGFVTDGLQELTMLRLAVAGHARYVIWEEKRDVKRTMIVHPNHIGDMLPEAFCPGFDMRWLVERIREAHRA